MSIQDLADWLKVQPASEAKDQDNFVLASKYLEAILSIKDELEYQAEICNSKIVTLTLNHVKDDIVDRHLLEALRKEEY